MNTGRVLFFVLTGSAAIVGVSIGVAGALNADETQYRGTFTEESCTERTRFGCRSVGAWVSDDGTIQLDDVYLDGVPDSSGTAEAQYHPSGIGNSDDDKIVHTSFGVAIEPFVPVGMIALAGGLSYVQWRKWRGSWK
jgi:hypothetical protein